VRIVTRVRRHSRETGCSGGREGVKPETNGSKGDPMETVWKPAHAYAYGGEGSRMAVGARGRWSACRVAPPAGSGRGGDGRGRERDSRSGPPVIPPSLDPPRTKKLHGPGEPDPWSGGGAERQDGLAGERVRCRPARPKHLRRFHRPLRARREWRQPRL
jgi:hypothetical protein